MILYYAPHTCALASHIALEQAGADYQVKRIDFSKNEQRSPEYLRVNPKGRVPALVTDRGILTETPAILIFIARASPQRGWRRSMTLSRSHRCRRSTATCARPSTLHTHTACAATVGLTIRRPSRR